MQQQPHILTDGKITNYLIKIWKWMVHGDEVEPKYFDIYEGEEIKNSLILFALKTFAANLAKLMLQKKKTSPEAEKYFEQYGSAEKELNEILVKLNSYLDKQRKE